jgi:hypothetical protein
MRQVLGPFAVGLKIEQAGLDLDDPDVPSGRQTHHVGAPSVGERKLGHHRMPERAQRPANAALDLCGNRRLAPVEGHDGIGVFQQFSV